ncbi:MAG TPA: YlxR family protein [Candidatus Dormibacteraeota bacterium]|nr:YlxR family protein [Candidatus Dormibacteraeota bacterium]
MSQGDPNLPTRTCVGCRVARPKRELIRLVRTPDAAVVVDPSGKLNGRGAYLCPDDACWIKAERRRGLERALTVRLDAAAWQNLIASRPITRPTAS